MATTKEGYLRKDGVLLSSRYYFVLVGSEFSAFKAPGDTTPYETMMLQASSTVTLSKSGSKIKIKVKTGKETWGLATEGGEEEEAHSWVAKLTDTVAKLGASSAPPSSSAPAVAGPRRSYKFDQTDFLLEPRYEPTCTRVLGAGAFGVVISAKDLQSGKHVAIKKCLGVFDRTSDAKKFAREIRLMRTVRHPNVLSLLTIQAPTSTSFTELYIVSELMDVDLHTLLHKKHEDLTNDHIQSFAYQIFCGLNYLHAMNVIHRDLKPMNILLTRDCDVKICDLGLARGIHDPDDLQQAEQELSEYVVTRWYRAPEVQLTPGQYGKAMDVWSVGCIMGEMCGRPGKRRPMFPAETYDQLFGHMTNVLGSPSDEDLQWIPRQGVRDFVKRMPPRPKTELSRKYPDAAANYLDLLSKLLEWDPSKRPSTAQALEHKLFADIRDESAEATSPQGVEWGDLEGLKGGRAALRKYLLQDIASLNPEANHLLEAVDALSPAEPVRGA